MTAIDQAISRPLRGAAAGGPTVAAWKPWLYLLPTLLLLGTLVYLPLGRALGLSFYQWNLMPTSPATYVGLENYQRLIALPEMQRALWNTLLYIVGLFPLSVMLPLAIAILTDDIAGRARDIYRGLIFVPMVLSPVVVAIVWRWLLNPDHGLIDAAIVALGLSPIRFLADAGTALPSMIWITGWKLVGFSTLLLSAANAAIDRTYIEAARLDGASRWQIIRDVRLPLLSPTILMLSVMTILLAAQWSFVYISVLTHGGPLKSTTNIYYLLWDYGFGNLAAGWSSAAGIIAFVMFAAVAALLLRLGQKRAVYDD